MRPILLLCVVALTAMHQASAAPFVVCDAVAVGTGSKPTIATFFIDGLPGVDNPVTDLTKPCHYDLANVPMGAHTVSATFSLIDPIQGRLDSIKSTSANFTLQAAPVPPSGLSISPK
jgi:hypothetical protein